MKRSALLLLFVFVTIAPSAWAVNLSGSGTLPRGASTTLQLAIEVSNVPLTDLVESNAEKTLHNRMEVYLEDLSTSKRIRYTDEPTNDTFTADYTVRIVSSETEMKDELAGTKLLTTTYIIEQGSAPEKTLQELVTDGVVRVKIKYTPAPEGGESEEKTISAKQNLGVVNAAPANVIVTPQHFSLEVEWDAVTTVPYNKGDPAAPTGATVILVDTSVATSLNFEAKTFKDDPADETNDTTCAFTADADANTCSLEECADAHLDLDQVAGLEGVQLKPVSQPSRRTTITELDIEKHYAVIVVYAPDALKRSACVMGQPKENTTLTELNGGKKATPGDPYCFIATAAYGTSLHPHLNTLRWFRDNALLTTSWGRAFVDAYYEYAPPVARWLEEHDTARAAVRLMLWPIVNLIEWAHSP